MMNEINWKQAMEAPTENFHARVLSTLHTLPEQEEVSMKPMRRMKRGIVIAAAAVMVISGGVFAASQAGYIRSDWRSTYSLKDAAAVEQTIAKEKVAGISSDAKFLESFSNGFVFEKGTVDGLKARADGGAEEVNYQSIDVSYTKDGERVYVEISPVVAGITDEFHGVPTALNGETVSVTEQDYKCVNEGYEKTEEERTLEQSGALMFSYDDSLDTPETYRQYCVSWLQDGMRYSVSTLDNQSSLTTPDLLQMAAELMNG